MAAIHRELVRFLIVGVGSNILNFLAYLMAVAMGAPLMIAAIAGYVVGLFNSYWYGKKWVFNAAKDVGRMAPLGFAFVYAIGGVGMSAIIEMLDRVWGLDYRVCWLFGAAFAFTNNFLGSKWLVFRERRAHHGN